MLEKLSIWNFDENWSCKNFDTFLSKLFFLRHLLWKSYVTRYHLGKRARLKPLSKGQSFQMFFIWCHWRAQWFAFCDFVTFSIGGVWPLEALEESSSFSSTISVIRPPVPASFSWVTFRLGPTTVHKIFFTSRIMFV